MENNFNSIYCISTHFYNPASTLEKALLGLLTVLFQRVEIISLLLFFFDLPGLLQWPSQDSVIEL